MLPLLLVQDIALLSSANVLFKSGYVSDAVVTMTIFMEVCGLFTCINVGYVLCVLQVAPDSVIGHFAFGNILAVKVCVCVCSCICICACVSIFINYVVCGHTVCGKS